MLPYKGLSAGYAMADKNRYSIACIIAVPTRDNAQRNLLYQDVKGGSSPLAVFAFQYEQPTFEHEASTAV